MRVLAAAAAVAAAATLALTRPGPEDRQRPLPATETWPQTAWRVAAARLQRWQAGETPEWPAAAGPIPLDLWSAANRGTTDYVLFTMSAPKNPTSEKRRLGILGRFIPHMVRDDLLALATVLFIVYALTYMAPGWVFRNTRPSLLRPWSFVLTSLYADSIVSTVLGATALVNSGILVQQSLGRQGFLVLFFLPGALASFAQLLVRRFPQPVGCEAAFFGLVTYTAFAFPNQRFTMHGTEVNGFGLMVMQSALSLGPLLSDPMRLKERLPSYSTGAAVGFCAFLLVHPRLAQSWIPYEGPQVAATVLAGNLLGSLLAYMPPKAPRAANFD